MSTRDGSPPEGLSDAMLEAARIARVGVVVTAVDGDDPQSLWISDVVLDILRRSRDELLTATPLSFVAPEAMPDILERLAARTSGGPLDPAFDTVALAPDGTRIPLRVAVSQVRVGGRRAIVAFVVDMSARRDAEEALRRSEARFRALIDSAPDAITITRRGVVLFANPVAARVLGFDAPQQMIGFALDSVLDAEDAAVMHERMRAMIERGERFPPREYRVVGRDGRPTVVEISSHVIDFEGAPAILGFGRDVTDRVRMQDQLARADRLAALGTLAAGVAHEINNPLAFVTLGIDSLEAHIARAVPDPAVRADLVSRLEPIRTGAARVAEIVRDLRAFSRGDDEPACDVDVGAVVRSAERLASHELRHRARVETRVEGALRVHGHRGRLEQVIVNLLVNAAQALHGRADGRVQIRCLERDARVVIEIEDDGPGIAPEILGRIFDPFFTTKPAGVGTGLGLAICHSIVTRMGGEISIESEVGRGTVARVVLPAARGLQPVAAIARSAPAAGDRLRVLVVDDEPALGRMLHALLSGDHEVAIARDGIEALERISERAFDVVLCDLVMPRMGGRELHARVAADRPGLASSFVFMTGGALDPATDGWLASLDAPRLWKPFTGDVLLDALRRAACARSERAARS